jgi:DNA polymerase-3 subunit gamma/tau
MLEAIIYILIGAFIGWNLPQPSWAKSIQESGKEGSSMIYAAMTTRKPILKDNFQVELFVDNKSQVEELMEQRTEIHEFLRKGLKNGGIEITFTVEKNIKKRKAYTDDEKFARMAEKNPALLKLKKELGLDFI